MSTPTLTSQQQAMLAEQKAQMLSTEEFQTKQEIYSSQEKSHQSAHDAILAVIEGIRGS